MGCNETPTPLSKLCDPTVDQNPIFPHFNNDNPVLPLSDQNPIFPHDTPITLVPPSKPVVPPTLPQWVDYFLNWWRSVFFPIQGGYQFSLDTSSDSGTTDQLSNSYGSPYVPSPADAQFLGILQRATSPTAGPIPKPIAPSVPPVGVTGGPIIGSGSAPGPGPVTGPVVGL